MYLTRPFLARRHLAQQSRHLASLSLGETQQRARVIQPATPAVEEEPRSMLLDKFGRHHNYLRISLTERCNLRCQYCMPEDGVELQPDDKMMSTEELIRVANVFVDKGVDKIRLTGGEPLVRKDILQVCETLGAMPGLKKLAITTNGLVLKKKLPALQQAGVNLLNISLDTLVPAKFQFITRRLGQERVVDAIHAAVDMGFKPVKVNCVVKRGMNDDEIHDFVEWTRHVPIEIRFIEYMPFDSNKWNSKALMSYIEMVEHIQERYPDFQRAQFHDDSNPTSKTWHVPGFAGRIGFISSMSNHFCGTCNRLRITADGNLKACLFGAEEMNLRDAMRSGATNQDLEALIGNTVQRKKPKLGGHANAESISKGKNRPMILIGG